MLFFVLFFVELALLFLSSRLLTRSLSRLFYTMTRSEKVTVSLLALLFLPGVILHELSHFLMASILFVPTGEMEFMPKVREGSVKLGSVQIAKADPFRRVLIGLAPIILGASSLLGGLFFASSHIFSQEKTTVWQYLLAVYIIFEIGNTMFSSRKDVEGLFELLLGVVGIAVLLFIIGLEVPLEVRAFFSSPAFASFFQNASLLLLIPLGINGLVIGTVRILHR